MNPNKYDKVRSDEEDFETNGNKGKDPNASKTKSTKINIDGHIYDYEDGNVYNYIEIYIPVIRKYMKINSCHLFQYFFGVLIVAFNIWLFYTLFFDPPKGREVIHHS